MFESRKIILDKKNCVRQIIENNKEKNIETHIVFVGLEKAYDNVPENKVWQAMRRLYIKYKLDKLSKEITQE